ncbi:pyocin knob domain-containing protein [Agrobacterium tumefaciens]|uniref:pyocin knob domain-containing protein n=1 Tax=Agrobacterium tumefaciens TaxID=358 RepID=UPI00157398B7
MAGVAYYNTGTATVAVNSKTVTGTGTNWLSVVGGLTAIKAGDKFGIHVGRPIIIASVDSNTQLTLEDNWPGPAQTNAAYKIELTSPDVIAVEAMRRMLGSLSSGVLYGLSQLPSTPSKALTIDENGSAALADLSPLGKSLIAALNSSAAYGALGVIPNAQLPTRLQSFATRVSDWNSATEFGVYFGDGSTANTPASPFAFIGLVTPYTSAYFVQRLIAFGNVGTANNIEYVRECSNGTFSAWGRVRSTEAELDARYNVRSQTITNSQLPGTQTGKKFTTFTEIAGPAFAAGGDYARIAPSDFGAGKPALYVSHPANVLQWNIGLWDGATTAGTINFSVGALTHNSQTIWTAANDGAGSGLDADLLDGQQGAYYRDRANHTGTQDVSTIAGISVFARTLLDDADGAAMFATMGATQSKASPGYVKLPNGIIIQWGRNFVGSDAAITLPIAFPTGVFAKTAVCELGYTATATRVVTIDNPSTLNSITVRFRDVVNGGAVSVPADGTVAWIAIGY